MMNMNDEDQNKYVLDYIMTLKGRFNQESCKYNEFTKLLQLFSDKSNIGVPGHAKRIIELFEEHEDLILPENSEMIYENEMKPNGIDDVLNFLNKIENISQGDGLYELFIEYMASYTKNKKTLDDVFCEVSEIFCDHPQLQQDFTQILYDSLVILCNTEPIKSPTLSSEKEDDQTNILHNAEPIINFTLPSEEENEINILHNVEPITNLTLLSEEENEMKILHNAEPIKSPTMPSEVEDEINILHNAEPVKNPTMPSKEDEMNILNYAQLITNSSLFPSEVEDDETNILHNVELVKYLTLPGGIKPYGLDHVLTLLNKIEKISQGDGLYERFAEYMASYTKSKKALEDISDEVSEIFRDHPDLHQDFIQILCDPKPILHNAEALKNPTLPSEEVDETNILHNAEALKNPTLPSEEEDETNILQNAEPLKNPTLPREEENEKNRSFNDRIKELISKSRFHDGESSKEVEDEDWEMHTHNCHNYEECSPSYKFLPNYDKRKTDEVLNNQVISVRGSNFKFKLINSYELSVIKCDDDRFEMCMLIKNVEATIISVERLIQFLNENQKIHLEPNSFCLEDHLRVMNIRCIEHIYGDDGLEMIIFLRENAADALPLVLRRLKQKQKEWKEIKSEYDVIWADVYVNNLHKSLNFNAFHSKKRRKTSFRRKGNLTPYSSDSSTNGLLLDPRPLFPPDDRFSDQLPDGEDGEKSDDMDDSPEFRVPKNPPSTMNFLGVGVSNQYGLRRSSRPHAPNTKLNL